MYKITDIFPKEVIDKFVKITGMNNELVSEIRDNIINEFNKKDESKFELSNINKLTIYNKLSIEFREKTNIKCLIYKDKIYNNGTVETIYGFLIYANEEVYDIYTHPNKNLDLKNLNKEYWDDEIFATDIQTNNSSLKKLLPGYITKNQLKEITGDEFYNRFISLILKKEKLLVKNGIYKVY